MKDKIISMLENDARLTAAQIAAALGSDEKTVSVMIEELENEGVIAGYKAIINPELRKSDTVSALIEASTPLQSVYAIIPKYSPSTSCRAALTSRL